MRKCLSDCKIVRVNLLKLNIYLLYQPAIPYLGTYMINECTCPPKHVYKTYIVALLPIVFKHPCIQPQQNGQLAT